VQSTYPDARFGFISAGREGAPAVFFSFDSVIGNVGLMPVRFIGTADRAVSVQHIPRGK
jgi:hypothetical protein